MIHSVPMGLSPVRSASVQFDSIRSGDGSTESDQAIAVQHQSRDMAVGAVLRVLESEGAFEAEPAIFAAAQAQSAGVNGLIDQLHACRLACVAAQRRGAFRSGARSAPECEADRNRDHQNQ
jgi:hypothetical protein